LSGWGRRDIKMKLQRAALILAALVVLSSCGGLAATDDATDGMVVTSTTSAAVDEGRGGTPDGSTQTSEAEPSRSDEEEPQMTSESTNDVAGQTTPSNTSRPEPASETTSPATANPVTANVEPGLQPFVDEAVADLSSRLGGSTVEVVLAETVVWPDSSLGCPTPGMLYEQVTTDGARILLAADGRDYHYHMGGSQYSPFLCETPSDV
jgi:hypothetical protein